MTVQRLGEVLYAKGLPEGGTKQLLGDCSGVTNEELDGAQGMAYRPSLNDRPQSLPNQIKPTTAGRLDIARDRAARRGHATIERWCVRCARSRRRPPERV